MKYKNAAEILPPGLLREVQYHIEGELLYIPKSDSKQEWGAVSGTGGLDESFLHVGKSVVIPHAHSIDSLNLSLAVGIGIYEFSKS